MTDDNAAIVHALLTAAVTGDTEITVRGGDAGLQALANAGASLAALLLGLLADARGDDPATVAATLHADLALYDLCREISD